MSPVNVGAIGSYIRDQREQAKISLRQLAQSAGISNPYLSQIERGLRRPSADILQQIAKGLRISAEALYVQAGFLEDRPPGSVVRDAVLTDPELTERQKQMLIEVYESFRKETAMARAEAGEIADDQTGLPPDPAALTWPENLSPAALAGRPRRLAIASYAGSEDAPADVGDVEDVTWLDDDAASLAGLVGSPWAAPGADETSGHETASHETASHETASHETASHEPGVDDASTAPAGADEVHADQPGADQPGADQPGADQPGADQPGLGGTVHQFPPAGPTR